MVARGAQVVEQGLDVERVGGGRHARDLPGAGIGKALGEMGEVTRDQLDAFLRCQRPDGECGPAARLEGVAGVAGQGGDDQPQFAGQAIREPGQQTAAFPVFELVERIENEDGPNPFPPGPGGKAVEVVGEDLHDVFRLRGNLLLCLLQAPRVGGVVRTAPANNGHHQPAHQGQVPRAHRGTADVVLEHEVAGVRLTPSRHPVSQQRGFATAGLAQNGQTAAVGALASQVVQPVEIGIAPHIKVGAPAPGIGFVIAAFTRPDVRHLVRGEMSVNGRREVGEHKGGEGAGIGIVLAQRDPLGLADRFHLVLQRVLTGGPDGILRQVIAALGRGILRVAQIEECTAGHFGVPEHAVKDFQFGDAVFGDLVPQPVFFIQERRRKGFRTGRPAVALAQQPDEVGAAALDLRQTVSQRFLALGLFLGHAPAQVHLDKLHRPPSADFAQGRPDLGHEFVAILDHVQKG